MKGLFKDIIKECGVVAKQEKESNKAYLLWLGQL
jgi:hypothetical protein